MRTNDKPQKLHEIFRRICREFGEESLAESRLKGLLSDYGGDSVYKFRNIITRSINCGIGMKLLNLRESDDADFTLKLNNLRQSFQEENFFRHDIANYIIDCYLFGFEWTDSICEYNGEENNSGTAKCGELSFVEHSGMDYCGNINQDGERSGFGVAKDADSSYYAGEWRLNMKNGIGIGVNAEREKYAGEWRLNRKAGIGVEITTDGNRYAGEWKNGKINGIGIVFYPNGERMCTLFCNGMPDREAKGIYYLKDGSYVIGNMTMAGPEGDCIHYRIDGTAADEEWVNGRLK